MIECENQAVPHWYLALQAAALRLPRFLSVSQSQELPPLRNLPRSLLPQQETLKTYKGLTATQGRTEKSKSQCSAPSASLFPTHCLAIQASDATSLVLLLSPPPRLFFLQGHLRALLGEARPQALFPCFAFFPAGHFLQNLIYCRPSKVCQLYEGRESLLTAHSPRTVGRGLLWGGCDRCAG